MWRVLGRVDDDSGPGSPSAGRERKREMSISQSVLAGICSLGVEERIAIVKFNSVQLKIKQTLSRLFSLFSLRKDCAAVPLDPSLCFFTCFSVSRYYCKVNESMRSQHSIAAGQHKASLRLRHSATQLSCSLQGSQVNHSKIHNKIIIVTHPLFLLTEIIVHFHNFSSSRSTGFS